MRGNAFAVSLSTVLLLTLAACSDTTPPDAGAGDISGIQAVVAPPGSCDLDQSLTNDTRDYFNMPERQDASALVRDLGTACNAADQGQVTALAWQVLGMIEFVLVNGTGGDAVIGARLATGLLACTQSLCLSSQVPAIDLSGAFAAFGLFSIHTTDSNDAIARGAVPFLDFQGNANSALWGVEVDLPWNQVTGANPVLVYGGVVTTGGVPLLEVSIGDLQYSLNVYPDLGEFPDGSLHVGACFATEVDLPVVQGDDSQPRMQREGVLLENYTPGFCPTSSAPQTASLLSPFVSLARMILPASIRSVFALGTKAPVVGGTPLDFSRFAPVAAAVDGTLTIIVPPNSRPVVNQPIGEIQVLAKSGAGTPMEKVKVTLYILNNLGIPAGAVLSGDIVSFTQERSGQFGIATFPDDGTSVVVNKAGGYKICARGELGGFTFTDACTSINVKSK